jgi:hypothetical protein
MDMSRNLANPGSMIPNPYPDRYLSPIYYTGPNDSGGIHFNSTILSHAAYLAVVGGSFNGFDVTGIGFDKVEQILYRAQTTYFQTGQTFNLAYDDIIQAATDLYPGDDVWQVTKALRAAEMNMSRTFNGDFDGDSDVDTADYVVWRKGLGTLYSQGVYDIWRANFGNPAAAAAAKSAAVPEPASLTLGIVMVVFTLFCRACPARAGATRSFQPT